MNEQLPLWTMPEPTREAGLAQLNHFINKAGRAYASGRNYDRGPGRHTAVSMLSPYLRHRLILEREVLSAVADVHSAAAAEKFISEVFWRTYFKGFLERRPSIWTAYQRDLAAVRQDMSRDGRLRADIEAAEEGRTGIDAFDHWADELTTTGYLHNHARMWFASIWIFTLRLPWQSGADFFLRYLLDGDPASNTLSWRWVAGLHTKGRTYLARRDNIARYTDGRFSPEGLAPFAEPLLAEDDHPLLPVPTGSPLPEGTALRLVHEDDCAIETLDINVEAGPVVSIIAAQGRSPGAVSEDVIEFTTGAVRDQLARVGGGSEDALVDRDNAAIVERARAAAVSAILTPYAPVGPVADRLQDIRRLAAAEGIEVVQVLRAEDTKAWPRADRGFFKMKKAIDKLMP